MCPTSECLQSGRNRKPSKRAQALRGAVQAMEAAAGAGKKEKQEKEKQNTKRQRGGQAGRGKGGQ